MELKRYNTYSSNSKASHSGMSLIAVLVSLAVLGVLSVAMARMFSDNTKNQSDLDRKLDLVAMNRYLMQAVSCSQTVASAPVPCNNGTFVAAKALSGANPIVVKVFDGLLPATATIIGQFNVRAKCGPNHTLIFEAKKIKDAVSSYKNISPNVPFGCVMP